MQGGLRTDDADAPEGDVMCGGWGGQPDAQLVGAFNSSSGLTPSAAASRWMFTRPKFRLPPIASWGTDATMAYTRDDGWVWAFVAIDHHTAAAWTTVAKRGDRFAGAEPIYDAARQRFGEVTPDVAREPPCNGCAERFIRTLKEQCLWARTYDDLGDLRRRPAPSSRATTPSGSSSTTGTRRHGHKTPREVYALTMQAVAA